MRDTFAAFQPVLREFEGGYVNDPDDPGGATNAGVTQAVYDAYRRDIGQPRRPVRQIAEGEISAIYRERYWDAVRGDQLPYGIDANTYDAGVNSGPSRGGKWLQKALGTVAVDGAIGPLTVAAAANHPDKVAVIQRAAGYRLGFVQALGHFWKYGNGWTRRIATVEAWAVEWWLSHAGAPADHVAAALNDDADAKDTTAKRANGTAGGTGTVAVGDGAAVGTGDVWTWVDTVLAIGGVALLLLTAWLLWRAHARKTQARAYRAKASEALLTARANGGAT